MNHMHPLMNYLTGVMDVPGFGAINTEGGIPEIDMNLSQGSYWGHL